MNEDFRKSAPEPLEAVQFNLPKPFETELSNGLKVVIIEDDRHPLISFRLAFRTGDIEDADGEIGVTSAMTAILTEGTERLNSREIAEEIERLGASLSANAGMDNSIVSASTLSNYKSEVIGLLAELVLTPTFPQDELDLYKQNSIEGIKFQRSQPDFLADEQVAGIMYGSHPYGIHSSTAEDLTKLTREQLIAAHKRIFIPNNATLFVVGDVDSSELVKEIESLFGGWERGEITNSEFPELPVRTKRSLTIVDRPGSTQSNIVLANLGITRKHPDYFPVLVMNQILGAGASSRLFMNLREEKGYTYGAYSRTYSKRLAGTFEATSEVRTAVTGDSLKEFFFELERIRDEQASEEELSDAKNFLTGVFPIRAETQTGLTGLIVAQKLYDLPEDYLDTYRENVDAITLEDVQMAANKYISPDKIAMVIVGDAEEVLPQVETYTEDIEVFDTEGNAKDLADYMNDSNEETVNVEGNWKLSLEAMGQQLEVDLMLTQEGEAVSGKLTSMFGEGEFSGGKVKGSKISAVAKTEFQAQEIELGIKGNVKGDSIEGTMTTSLMPMELEFTGKRQ